MACKIGLFHWNGTAGHRSWAVLNHRSVFHVNLLPPSLLPDCEKWLFDELGFRGPLASNILGSAIASYCRFLQRAQAHRVQGRADEAFLHFVIALDLLLGSEGKSSESVCLRAAVLVHRQLSMPFDSQIAQLKKLYDRRSKYVHEGRLPSSSDLKEVEAICTEVLWALLATSASRTFSEIEAWFRQIDFVGSALRASRDISDTEFASIGVPVRGHKRVPPNRIS